MIADIAERDLWIIFDEIYERLAYAPNHINILSVAPDLRDKTILVNRAKQSLCDDRLEDRLRTRPQSLYQMNTLNLTSNASSIARWAAWGAVRTRIRR